MITLKDLATNSGDKLVQGFVSEVITDSEVLGALPFDNALTPAGTGDLVYSYKRVKTPMQAAFRSLGEEPTKSAVEVERITTNIAILSAAFDMDRVAADAASDLLQLHIEECKNAIIRAFNKQLIGGDKTAETKGFDGLAKALKGTKTEFTSAVDMAAITDDSAMAFAEEMDTMLSSLMRTPNHILVSPKMKVKLNAICRRLGINAVTPDTAGNMVQAWNGIPIVELKDGALATDEVYAVCYGLDAFHGVTLKGENAVAVHQPNWDLPGAVKTVDAEFVCGCALKATTAAGVLKPKAK